MAGVKRWLSIDKKAEEPYLFHDVKPNRVFADSKLLFSFEAKLFGKAVAKTNVKEITDEIQEKRIKKGEYVYKHSIVFKAESIALLQRELPKKEIKQKLKINCDRPFRYLTKAEYNKILKLGGLPPEL